MKGFVGILLVVLLVLPIFYVWGIIQNENLRNLETENFLIKLEQKKAIEKDIKYLIGEAVKRSKNKEELIENLMYVSLHLKKEYSKNGVKIDFMGGWCGVNKKLEEINHQTLEKIIEYANVPIIIRGENFESGKGCIVVKVEVDDLKFEIQYLEGKL